MSGSWPSTIDPVQLADTGARLTGELPLKGMRRLLESCLEDTGSAAIDLQFERNQGDGVRMMWGTIDARLRFTCQRCLEPFDFDLHSQPRLLLLLPGERAAFAEDGDVPIDALVVEQPIALSALIEDELLLVMPMVPLHAASDCPVQRVSSKPAKEPAKERKKTNPFSVLEQLKRTGKAGNSRTD